MSEEEFLLHHPYHEWISTYSSPDYLRLPAIAEAALDEVVAVNGCSYGKFFPTIHYIHLWFFFWFFF